MVARLLLEPNGVCSLGLDDDGRSVPLPGELRGCMGFVHVRSLNAEPGDMRLGGNLGLAVKVQACVLCHGVL